jgi:vacuolar protein sorting-associated protein 72
MNLKSRSKNIWFFFLENKSFRDSTARKREELEKRQKERDQQKVKAAKRQANADEQQPEYRRLTQEELMAEAKITEKINLASLDAYQKLELEKKRKVVVKNVFNGPIIRYHSLTMPVLAEDRNSDEIKETEAKQSRNFITFTDEHTLREIFPSSGGGAKPKPPNQRLKVCAVTGLPAKYFDPVTQIPYANLYAFKVIRQSHGGTSGSSKSQKSLNVTA